MGLEIAAAVMVFTTICGLLKYKNIENKKDSAIQLPAITLTKEIEDKVKAEYEIEKNTLIETVNIARMRYDKLESKYIPLLQENEILRAKQIKNKTLASEIFGDDNE